MSRVDDLEKFVKAAFETGCERARVETGRYKGFMRNTVEALGRRGYKVERIPRSFTGFYIYPKKD